MSFNYLDNKRFSASGIPETPVLFLSTVDRPGFHDNWLIILGNISGSLHTMKSHFPSRPQLFTTMGLNL